MEHLSDVGKASDNAPSPESKPGPNGIRQEETANPGAR